MSADLPTLGIGVDIGGTSTKAAVIDAARQRGRRRSSLPTQGGAKGVVATATQATLLVARSAVGLGQRCRTRSASASPAPSIRNAAPFASPSTSASATTTSISARGSTAELGVDVHVENDVRAAALGADWYLATEVRPGRRSRLSQHRHRHRRRVRRARPVAARQRTGRRRDRAHPDRSAGPAVRLRSDRLHRGHLVGFGDRADVADRDRRVGRCALHRAAAGGDAAARAAVGRGDRRPQPRRAAARADMGSRGDRSQRRRGIARRRAPRCDRRSARRRMPSSPSSSVRSTSARGCG